MGLLVSINGIDFEPYADAITKHPLVNRKDSTQKVLPVERDFDHPEDFRNAMNKATAQAKASKQYEEASKAPEHVPKKAVYAHELMSSPVVTLSENQSINEAVQSLDKNHIRHLPIVNSDHKIVGILSDRNVAFSETGALLKDVMDTNIIAAETHTRLQEIARAMLSHRINCVPIIDKDREPIGIVTTTDILESILKNSNIDLFV